MNAAEEVLLARCTDTDSMEQFARLGVLEEWVPTEAVWRVFAWAQEQFFISGRTQAPSRAALMDTWGKYLGFAGVELPPDDVEVDTVEWAVEHLRSTWLLARFQDWGGESAIAVAKAPPDEQEAVLAEHSAILSSMVLAIQPKHTRMSAPEGVAESARQYDQRASAPDNVRGLLFGMPEIDEHTYGIHDGELALLAAPPKTGKSYMAVEVARQEWRRGSNVTLFTLENSVSMTYDRLACLELGFNPTDYQRGRLTAEQRAQLHEFVNDMAPILGERLHVIMPEPGKRTVEAIVRQARLMDANRLIIDQLTFMEHPSPARKQRWEIVRDLLHELKTAISSGNDPIPCLMMHQINREGVKAVFKQDNPVLEMHMLAEGSEAERTADWVFGLLQTPIDRNVEMARFQVLASRREVPKAWLLQWRISHGAISVLRELDVT